MKCGGLETKMKSLMTWNMKPMLVNQIAKLRTTIIPTLINLHVVRFISEASTSVEFGQFKKKSYVQYASFLCIVWPLHMKETRLLIIYLGSHFRRVTQPVCLWPAHWNVMISYQVIVVKSDLHRPGIISSECQ